MEQTIINSTNTAINDLILLAQYGKSPFFVDYDKEADVLYISFQKPQNASDSEIQGDVIVHYRNSKIVGVTILNASKNLK